MTTRFWRPIDEHDGGQLQLVACVQSGRCLYVLLEGESLPPPADPHSDRPEMLSIAVRTESGHEVRFFGMSGGNYGKGTRPRNQLAQFECPPEPTEPLIVTLSREDATPIWEVTAVPHSE